MQDKYNIAVEYTPYEHRIVVKQLFERRNELIWENKPVEDMNRIIQKTVDAKPKKKKWWRYER